MDKRSDSQIDRDARVDYWNEPQGPNHRMRFARCQDITFAAFPYQCYYARRGNYSAQVAGLHGKWSARVDIQGQLVEGRFTNTSDDAFTWAARRLLALNDRPGEGTRGVDDTEGQTSD